MRAVLLFALVCVCLAGVYAMPSSKDGKEIATKDVKEPKDIKDAAAPSKDVKEAIKAAKDAKKTKKECAKECGVAYDPICAHIAGDAATKPRTFGSLCAMEVHNCEMGTKMTVKSKGECPGAGGVRLS